MPKSIPLLPLLLSDYHHVKGNCYQMLLFSFAKTPDKGYREVVYLSIDEAINDENRKEKVYCHIWYNDDHKKEYYLINDRTMMYL